MGSYTLSGKADADIEEIAEASFQQWGPIRAETYILG
jgi:plasmid stabilization system protein ParE